MVNKFSSLAVLFLMLFAFGEAVNAQKWDNKAVSLHGKRVLLFDKNGKGYVHDNIQAGREAFLKLGREQGFRVDTSSNSAVFYENFLKQFCAIVFSNTNNDVFDTEEQKVAFMRYVQAGGGFVGLHIACGTERHWTWFKNMIGGTFDFHPPFQEFTVHVIDPEHPSTAAIPRHWTVRDELYFLREMNPSIRILMVSDFSGIKYDKPLPSTFGKVFPSVWCNTFDGGRQWYTALGHDKSDFQNPVYLQHILGGLKWAASGKLDYTKAYAVKSE
jgi:type 1 glutamine amidotransferase